jgi:hypothetical protein
VSCLLLLQLVVCRITTQRLTGYSVHELDPSGKLKGFGPYAYLNNVLTRLPTHMNNVIEEMLPHNWKLVKAGKG